MIEGVGEALWFRPKDTVLYLRSFGDACASLLYRLCAPPETLRFLGRCEDANRPSTSFAPSVPADFGVEGSESGNIAVLRNS